MYFIKFFVIGSISLLLASCETASQKAVSGAASSASSGSSASKSDSVKKGKGSSLFAKGKESAADKLISVGDRVLFDYDSAELSNDAKLILDKQSRFLRANTDLTFTIEGHCDERGTEEYNRALGERRALSVRDALAGLGVSADRIRTMSFGEDRPADPGLNEAAYSRNRRGEFILLKPKPSN